jgi:hypothetical protein
MGEDKPVDKTLESRDLSTDAGRTAILSPIGGRALPLLSTAQDAR